MSFPHPDLALSPHTGYTRSHWESVADNWLSRGFAAASPHGSLWRIPGRHAWSGPESDALEGFARGFLLAAGRICDGDSGGWAPRFAAGLMAGTQRGGNEEWLRGVDCRLPLEGKTQPIVEAANIAFALHLSRRQLWDTLDDKQREPIADWLAHHARRQAWPNNWVLFTAVIEAFLASTGYDTADFRSDENVRWVESWYLGDGWYTDGQRRNIDHYNAWVIHPFLWAWYDMVGDRDPDAAWRWRQRLAAFLRSYPAMFGANGSPMQQGRSLTYRTATLAPLWLGEFTGMSTMAPGATRRSASGTLRYFVDRGVGADGPPGLGWTGAEYLPLTQRYSGPGSPFFAGMGFIGLALDASHPVWTDTEQAQPAEDGDAIGSLPGAGWIVSSKARDGVVRLYNHGADKITAGTPDPDPLYIKLAYATHAAPGHDAAFADHADNEFVLLGGELDHRRGIEEHQVTGAVALSRGRYASGEVVSASIVVNDAEVRCHWIPGGPRRARDGGFLLSDARAPHAESGADYAYVSDKAGLSAIVLARHGFDSAHIRRYNNANALGSHGAVPLLEAQRAGKMFVAVHSLSEVDDITEWLDRWRSHEITVDGTVVTVAGQRVDLASLTR